MIVAEKPLNVQTSGVGARTFGIKLNRKMFKILSADLYSDKFGAVIRELSTNAADAHIAAGKSDVPFVVHLPNTLEPYFEVRDYGTGLDEERIFSVYTQYGESDKVNSNDFTGCLGLGSKSPFAYTDSFTVESRTAGVKRVYTAFQNEAGFPSLSEALTVEPTDEADGLSVKFPVKSGDFYKFTEKAKGILRWFKTTPIIKGSNDITIEPREYLYKTDKFGVYKSHGNSSYAVMGNVAYPIHKSQIFGYYDNPRERALLDWGVELYVGIGDVDITASRESLSYDDDEIGYNEEDGKGKTKTVPFLKQVLTNAVDELETFVTAEIANSPDIWSARRALNKVRNSFNSFNFVAEYNGEKINDYVKVEEGKCGGLVLTKKGYSYDKPKIKKVNLTQIPADGTAILLNDGKGGFASARRYMVDKNLSTVILINTYDLQWLNEQALTKVVIRTSTLPKPERTASSRGSVVKAQVYQYKTSGTDSTAGSYWTALEDFDLDDGGVYVPIKYFRFLKGENSESAETFHPEVMKSLADCVQALTGKDLTVYGVRPSDMKTINDSDGDWQTLTEYLEEVYSSVKDKVEPLLKFQTQLSYIDYDWRSREINVSQLKPDNLLRRFFDLRNSVKGENGVDLVNPYKRVIDFIGKSVPAFEDKNHLQEMIDGVLSKYPMLRHIHWYGRSIEADITNYIRLVDGC